ncbi:hypothetical protein SOVF_006710 isoform B [Spinacia oleracea]|nr:hypothetical protein SOVF_006710 isoform B [Spinacia oleracea]
MDDIEESNIRRNEGLQEAVIMLAYWKQRAKGKWLALGDSNTSFFYKSAKARKVKNEIRFIQDRCGNWIADQAQIGRELEDYFKELFHANDQHNVKLDIPVELGDLPISQNEEFEKHLFWDCWLAAHIWKSCQLGINTSSAFSIPMSSWVKNFLIFLWKEDGHESSRVNLFIAVMWGIWIQTCPATLLRWIQGILKEVEQANCVSKKHTQVRCIRQEVQQHRLENQKVCLAGQSDIHSDILLVDGTWKASKGTRNAIAAVGWILVRAQSNTHEGSECVYAHSALQTEALAVSKGLAYARQYEVDSIIVKTGSSKLVQAS